MDEKLEEGVLLEEENHFLSKIKDAYLSSKKIEMSWNSAKKR